MIWGENPLFSETPTCSSNLWIFLFLQTGYCWGSQCFLGVSALSGMLCPPPWWCCVKSQCEFLLLDIQRPPEVRCLDPKKIPKTPNLRRYHWTLPKRQVSLCFSEGFKWIGSPNYQWQLRSEGWCLGWVQYNEVISSMFLGTNPPTSHLRNILGNVVFFFKEVWGLGVGYFSDILVAWKNGLIFWSPASVCLQQLQLPGRFFQDLPNSKWIPGWFCSKNSDDFERSRIFFSGTSGAIQVRYKPFSFHGFCCCFAFLATKITPSICPHTTRPSGAAHWHGQRHRRELGEVAKCHVSLLGDECGGCNTVDGSEILLRWVVSPIIYRFL